jgi:hypothetical protein
MIDDIKEILSEDSTLIYGLRTDAAAANSALLCYPIYLHL